MELSGPIFKMFRERKGFSVPETAKGICSPQFLRKYEAGNSDVSLTNSLLLLDRINITMDEFLHEYNERTFDNFFIAFETKLEKVIHSRNTVKQMHLIQELETRYEETGELKYHLLLALARSVYNSQHQKIFDLDWQSIRNYLHRVEQWERFEFYLCSYAHFPLSNEELAQVSRKLMRQPKRALGTIPYTDDFLVRLAGRWLAEGELKLCRSLVNAYFTRQYEDGYMRYLIMDVYMKFVEGQLEILDGNREAGIRFFTDLDIHPGYTSTIYEHYIRALNESKSRDAEGK